MVLGHLEIDEVRTYWLMIFILHQRTLSDLNNGLFEHWHLFERTLARAEFEFFELSYRLVTQLIDIVFISSKYEEEVFIFVGSIML